MLSNTSSRAFYYRHNGPAVDKKTTRRREERAWKREHDAGESRYHNIIGQEFYSHANDNKPMPYWLWHITRPGRRLGSPFP